MGQAQAVQNDGDTEYRLRKAERLQLIKREAENMGAEIVKVWNAERRDDFLWFDPDKLVVVTDEKSDLYDARALEAPDEALVQSIMADGVLEPIGVRVNGKLENGTPNVEVVFGRRRVIAAREVNRRNKETGREPIRVPGLRKKNEAGNLLGVMISENEIRKGDSLLAKARKLQRYLDTGKSEIEAAVRFGVTRPTITNLLQLLELHPDVQKKIDVEGYPVAAAKELRDLPQEEQPAALDKLIEGGFLKGKSAVEAAKNLRRNGVAKSDHVKMMRRPVIETWKKGLAKVGTGQAQLVAAVLSFVLGHKKALADYPVIQAALEEPKVEKEKPVKTEKKTKAAKKS